VVVLSVVVVKLDPSLNIPPLNSGGEEGLPTSASVLNSVHVVGERQGRGGKDEMGEGGWRVVSALQGGESVFCCYCCCNCFY
jgi:hypothetical protein